MQPIQEGCVCCDFRKVAWEYFLLQAMGLHEKDKQSGLLNNKAQHISDNKFWGTIQFVHVLNEIPMWYAFSSDSMPFLKITIQPLKIEN